MPTHLKNRAIHSLATHEFRCSSKLCEQGMRNVSVVCEASSECDKHTMPLGGLSSGVGGTESLFSIYETGSLGAAH